MYVRNRMSTNPFTVSPEATIADTLGVMREKGIRRLPVLKNGKLVGIITERELLEVSPSPATSLSVFEINYLLSKTKISSIMTRDVLTITPDSVLEDAAVLMRDNKVGALPVVDDEKLVGIITETDLFDSFIEMLGFKDMGSRIAIEIADDRPGILAKITSIISQYDVNITHLVVYRNELIIRVNTTNINEIMNSLKENGFDVISVLKNE